MKKYIPWLAAALVLAPVALAEEGDWPNHGNAATSASGQKGLFNLIYGENLCHGQWAFSTYYNKWDRRVQSDPVLEVIDPLWTDWDMDVERLTVAIGYGITDKIELSVMAPYWSFDAEDIQSPFLSSGILNGVLFDQGVIDQSGFGNVRVGAKFQVARTETYAIGLMPFVDLPTGDDDEAVVTGDTGFGLTFAYNNRAGWVFNASYFDPGDSDFLDVSDELHVGIGYAKAINPKTEWITELAGIIYTDSDNGEHDAADITSGARWRLANPDWAVNAGLRVDLSDTSFDYTPIGGLVGLSYSPKNRYTLDVDLAGTGSGKVTGTKIDCGAVCQGTYHCGETVELRAEPEPKSRFERWEGACAGSDPSVTITLDGDKACTAVFVKLYDLTVEIQKTKHPDGDQPGDGYVKINPECRDKCTSTYDVGTKVNLQAVAAKSSTFEGWTVDCKGKDAATEVVLDGDKTCVATFQGPPRPCVDKPIVGDFAKCGRYEVAHSCDSATWSQIIEGYAAGATDVPLEQVPNTDRETGNEGKTPLCDVVNFLRACPEIKACVGGSEQGEAHCSAEERAAKIAGFLIGQGKYDFFKSLTADRIQLPPACQAEAGSGRSVGIYLNR